MTSTRRQVRHFTLVELLVIIAMTSILASLLLPSLKKARLKTKRALCLNNLKQLNIAQTSYSTESNGMLVSSSIGVEWSTYSTASLHVWGKDQVDPLVENYLNGNIQAFLCPVHDVDESYFEWQKKAYKRLTSYMSATNEGLSNSLPAGQHYWKRDGKNYHIDLLSKVEDTSQFLFADFIRFSPYSNKWNLADGYYNHKTGKPEGGNELQVNGSAKWRTFQAKQVNYQHGSWPYYWTDDDR